MTHLAQLPETGHLALAAVVLAVICLVGLGLILRWAQGLRESVAKELRREMESATAAQAVAVQDPLNVRESHAPASRKEIDELHGRIKRERLEIDRQLAELKQEDVRLREKLDDEISDLHNRINDVPARTIALLRETKGLI